MKTEKKCSENNDASECKHENTSTLFSPEDMISFRVVWNKKNYEVKFNAKDTAGNLKKHIESLTGIFLLLKRQLCSLWKFKSLKDRAHPLQE